MHDSRVRAGLTQLCVCVVDTASAEPCSVMCGAWRMHDSRVLDIVQLYLHDSMGDALLWMVDIATVEQCSVLCGACACLKPPVLGNAQCCVGLDMCMVTLVIHKSRRGNLLPGARPSFKLACCGLFLATFGVHWPA